VRPAPLSSVLSDELTTEAGTRRRPRGRMLSDLSRGRWRATPVVNWKRALLGADAEAVAAHRRGLE
jgi:hypothetical protein